MSFQVNIEKSAFSKNIRLMFHFKAVELGGHTIPPSSPNHVSYKFPVDEKGKEFYDYLKTAPQVTTYDSEKRS